MSADPPILRRLSEDWRYFQYDNTLSPIYAVRRLDVAGLHFSLMPLGDVMIRVPCAYFSLIFLIITLFLLYKARRLRRNLANHVCVCGYDLRAHAPGQRCPECGTEILAHHSANPR